MEPILNIIKSVGFYVVTIVAGFFLLDFTRNHGFSPTMQNIILSTVLWICFLVWLAIKHMLDKSTLMSKATIATWLWRIAASLTILIGFYVAIGNISGQKPTVPYAGTIVLLVGGFTMHYLGAIKFK